jgi:4-hydroxy-2-oxoglutarate aldolase
MLKLQGIFPAITTPFNHNGDLYEIKVRHNVEKWNLTGLAGYLVCGSTGETVHLGFEEKLRLFQWVAESRGEAKVLIAGTGSESVHETVALTNRAAELGYAAALVLTPSYYRKAVSPPEAQLLFYRTVADRAKIPILIYNIPQNTGVDLPCEVVAALSEHHNIVGIKESSGNVPKVERMVKETKSGFQVLVGSASTLAESLALGAAGGILAFANVAPYACISIWEACRTREMDAARDWQIRVEPAIQAVTSKYGIPGLKYAMDLNGYYGGPPRLPLTVASPEAQQEIARAFDGIKG